MTEQLQSKREVWILNENVTAMTFVDSLPLFFPLSSHIQPQSPHFFMPGHLLSSSEFVCSFFFLQFCISYNNAKVYKPDTHAHSLLDCQQHFTQ